MIYCCCYYHYYYYYYYYDYYCYYYYLLLLSLIKKLNKKNLFPYSIEILNLSLNELKQIAKMRLTKNYKNISIERLLSALDESEYNSIKHSENNFNNAKIKKIRENVNKLRD